MLNLACVCCVLCAMCQHSDARNYHYYDARQKSRLVSRCCSCGPAFCCGMCNNCAMCLHRTDYTNKMQTQFDGELAFQDFAHTHTHTFRRSTLSVPWINAWQTNRCLCTVNSRPVARFRKKTKTLNGWKKNIGQTNDTTILWCCEFCVVANWMWNFATFSWPKNIPKLFSSGEQRTSHLVYTVNDQKRKDSLTSTTHTH